MERELLCWAREAGEHQWADPHLHLSFPRQQLMSTYSFALQYVTAFSCNSPSPPVLKEVRWSQETSASKRKDLVIRQPWQKHLFTPTSPEPSCVHRNNFSSKWPFALGTQSHQALYEYPYPLWLQLIVFSLYWLLKGRDHRSYRSIPCHRKKNLWAEIPFNRDKR